MRKLTFLILFLSLTAFGRGYTRTGFAPTGFYSVDQLPSVQTTDATETVYHTETLGADSVVHVQVLCNAVKDDGAKRQTLEKAATFYRTGGGSAAAEGAVEVFFNEAGATYLMTLDVDGANAWEINITGLASENVDWKCFCRKWTFL